MLKCMAIHYVNPTTLSGDTAYKMVHNGLGKLFAGPHHSRLGFGWQTCIITKYNPLYENESVNKNQSLPVYMESGKCNVILAAGR